MKRSSAITVALGGLAACTSATQDQLAQDAAKQAIRPVLAERFPGVPLEGATDCIIDNASAGELVSLGADAAAGPTASTVELVATIATRPDALDCLVREGAALALVMQ